MWTLKRLSKRKKPLRHWKPESWSDGCSVALPTVLLLRPYYLLYHLPEEALMAAEAQVEGERVLETQAYLVSILA